MNTQANSFLLRVITAGVLAAGCTVPASAEILAKYNSDSEGACVGLTMSSGQMISLCVNTNNYKGKQQNPTLQDNAFLNYYVYDPRDGSYDYGFGIIPLSAVKINPQQGGTLSINLANVQNFQTYGDTYSGDINVTWIRNSFSSSKFIGHSQTTYGDTRSISNGQYVSYSSNVTGVVFGYPLGPDATGYISGNHGVSITIER